MLPGGGVRIPQRAAGINRDAGESIGELGAESVVEVGIPFFDAPFSSLLSSFPRIQPPTLIAQGIGGIQAVLRSYFFEALFQRSALEFARALG